MTFLHVCVGAMGVVRRGSVLESAHTMVVQPGAVLGRYKVEALIGRGGMGEVYRARDTTLGREVAIKALPESLATNPERLSRFEREAHLLASLNHPHIAVVYGFERIEGVSFLAMELVPGAGPAE